MQGHDPGNGVTQSFGVEWLGAEFEEGLVGHLTVGAGDGREPGPGEDVQAEVATTFGPLVGAVRPEQPRPGGRWRRGCGRSPQSRCATRSRG